MKRFMATLAAIGLAALWLPVLAQADFGIKAFDLTFNGPTGSTVTQAGSHPFSVTNTLEFETVDDPEQGIVPDQAVKDLKVELPEGLVGAPGATPRCSSADFINFNQETKLPKCSNSTAIGYVTLKLRVLDQPEFLTVPVYSLLPPPGVVQKFGFIAYGVPVTIEFTVKPDSPYNVVAHLAYIAQPLPVYGSVLTVWGNPADSAHDPYRGNCINATFFTKTFEGVKTTGGKCSTDAEEKPLVTLPRACTGPLTTTVEAASWQNPGVWVKKSALTNDGFDPPTPIGFGGCANLLFSPTATAQPTTKAAESPAGLEFGLDVIDDGLTSSTGRAHSDIRKAVVTLPEGMSANPSIAEGLDGCSEGDLQRETVDSAPGAGCPNASKIGSVEVETPLLEEPVNGSLFVAKPYENRFGSLLALYMVIRNKNVGVVVRQALKIELDPVTGRITSVADDLPQLPFSHFRLRFREGARSPLATPPGCGTYNATAVLTPWSGGAPVTSNSAFQIVSGPAGAPCSSAIRPFRPTLVAGTLNNSAGRYSPFNLRLTRSDGEQEITRVSIKLPPGVIGKLAGIPYCPEGAIAAAKLQSGAAELRSPSCPLASEVGRSLAGSGVGPSLAYAPGKLYLAGPYNGSALSLASVTAAKVGPFDLGTVVVRFALRVDPETAEVFIDSASSDPFPRIIDGVPVHLRDVRAYADRPQFVLNPTSCKPTETAGTVFGSGLDLASAAAGLLAGVSSPFQAADCASLGFKPRLALSLKGGTKRGATPRFKAVLTYPEGSYANISRAQVTLPHSEFLEQSHIQTICTRVQYAAGAIPGEKCPKASIYGYARAFTPLLDEPLKGPVFLRSSSHPLPDLVAALRNGQVNINLDGRIDSAKGGRIRNTFEKVPDAPVSRFVLEMQGGDKGLLVNSTNICRHKNRAIADFTGQNGKVHKFRPILRATGCRKASAKAKPAGKP
jgi:hypothetical protein